MIAPFDPGRDQGAHLPFAVAWAHSAGRRAAPVDPGTLLIVAALQHSFGLLFCKMIRNDSGGPNLGEGNVFEGSNDHAMLAVEDFRDAAETAVLEVCNQRQPVSLPIDRLGQARYEYRRE